MLYNFRRQNVESSMENLIQHRQTRRVTTLILGTVFYMCVISAYPCPSPCWCVDLNTTVVCNLTGITEIPKDLPHNVKTLLLRSNEIGHISATDLEGLNTLQSIDFTRNKLTKAGIKTGAFNLPSVKFLDLSANLFDSIPENLPPNLYTLNFLYNPITELKSGSFLNMSSIQYLNMLANQITTIDVHAFDGLKNIIEIDLSSNQLSDSSVNGKAFEKTIRLKSLKLNYNQLRNIPDTKYFPLSLQSLQLYGNKINNIKAQAFHSMKNLNTLALAQGQLTTIEDDAFDGLGNLTNLDLSQGQILSSITNDTFSGLTSLTSLSLDINKISIVEPGAFHQLKNIKEIGLTGNNLQTLDPGVLDTRFIPHLSTVYIYDNPWFCDCNLRWLREKMDNASYKVESPTLTKCAGPPPVVGKTWTQLKPSHFKC